MSFNPPHPPYPYSFQESSFISNPLLSCGHTPASLRAHSFSISISFFSHFLGICQLVYQDPVSDLSLFLPRLRIHGLAPSEAKCTGINRSDFNDTSWTDWAQGHKMVRAQHQWPVLQCNVRVPPGGQVDQVQSYQGWVWSGSTDGYICNIFLRKDHTTSFSNNRLL